MKRFNFLSQPCVIAAAFTLFLNHAQAERIFYDSFEASSESALVWTAGGHPNYFGIASEGDGSVWSTPYGSQGVTTYSNGIPIATVGFLPSESGDYSVKFNIASKASIGEYRAELWAVPFVGPPILLGHVVGDTDGSKNMSFSDEITWRYDYDFNGIINGAELQVKLMQDPNRSNWRHTPIWDNVSVDFVADNDSSPPKVLDIVDGEDRGSMVPNTLVTYTVTFDEDIDASTVDAADFENNGSSQITIGAISETSPGVFTVEVTPTEDGTLRLRISSTATIDDVFGNTLVPSPAIIDETTITVEGTLPLLDPIDIVDDKGGSPVAPDTLVTYTVTFSKDMDDSTVTADDFVNAGTAPVDIGTVTETATPGEFTVEATPTGGGTLQLSVKAFEVLEDTAGNELNTDSAIADDTTIAVDATDPILDEIVDDQAGSSVVANTLVTYSVNFLEDMDESTVTAADFDNAGTAPIIINNVSEATPGAFRVEVTPSGSGTLQLRIKQDTVLKDAVGNSLDTTSALLDDTTITVTDPPANPYDTWASGAVFGDDGNGDGVVNGMAWLLGAADMTADARVILPVTSRNGGNLRLTFRCLKLAKRGTAKLKVQFSSDLGQADLWVNHEAEVPDTDSTVDGVIFDTTSDGDFINVVAEIPASGGKVFARLVGVAP